LEGYLVRLGILNDQQVFEPEMNIRSRKLLSSDLFG
jgi:hypothetical protein